MLVFALFLDFIYAQFDHFSDTMQLKMLIYKATELLNEYFHISFCEGAFNFHYKNN